MEQELGTANWELGAAGGQFILITAIKESAANKVEKAQLKWSSLQSAEMVSVSVRIWGNDPGSLRLTSEEDSVREVPTGVVSFKWQG
ncbi:GD14438 [Drosophila simulans]|uniref:GD14438 n=1 Tax=Drosophila simulans TaxID=7240 RepID=B4QJ07_DROSI|nr:GD14438 [Drosophila simulans]